MAPLNSLNEFVTLAKLGKAIAFTDSQFLSLIHNFPLLFDANSCSSYHITEKYSKHPNGLRITIQAR
jgi:hypothetical protein